MQTTLRILQRYAKEGLLALLLTLFAPTIIGRLLEIEGWTLRGAFIALLAISWGGMIAAGYVQRSGIRWLFAVLIGIGSYFPLVFERVTNQFLTYDAFITMLESIGFAGDAMAQNGASFLAALPVAALAVVAIGISPTRQLPIVAKWAAAVPLLSFAALTALLYMRGGDGGRGQAPGMVLLSYAALAGYEEATAYSGPRKEPLFVPATAPKARHIVLIVDESIAPKYLQINDPGGVPTPLSRDWDGAAIQNFGIAAAVSGCSAGSNVTLRFGGTRDNYRAMVESYPAIWAYAKEAGMRTVHIDGQTIDGAMQNFMDEEEAAQIDERIQFDAVPAVDRDQAIARELVKQLADAEPKFILVNKIGAHFPVHDKFPDEYLRYQPVLPRGGFRDVIDTGSRAGFGGTAEEWRRYRNSYRNTLAWNVGRFFEILLTQADLSNALLVYTADHGQNLHEDGAPGTGTHCHPEPESAEGAVPMVTITGTDTAGLDFARVADANSNRTSHYMIFPTLLEAMGYAPAKVEKAYGRSLLHPSDDPMTFNTKFNARLNADPVWRKAELAQIPRPPVSDTE